jgi:hypothetical protein
MKTAAVLGLQVLLVVAALVAYDAVRGTSAPPAPRDPEIPRIERLGPIGSAHRTETPAAMETAADAESAAATDRRIAELEARVGALAAQVEREVAARAALARDPAPPIDVHGILPATSDGFDPAVPSTANDVARFRDVEGRTRDAREMERRARVLREQMGRDDVRLTPDQERQVVEAMLRYQAALPDDPGMRNEPDDATREARRRRQELREAYEREIARIVPGADAAKIVRATDATPLRAAPR